MSTLAAPSPPPTVGRIVHFHRTSDGPPNAAIVCRVDDDGVCDLHVFGPHDAFTQIASPPMDAKPYRADVPYDAAGSAGSWSWPPRV